MKLHGGRRTQVQRTEKNKKSFFFFLGFWNGTRAGMFWRDFGTRDARALGVRIVNSMPRSDCFYFLFVASVGVVGRPLVVMDFS